MTPKRKESQHQQQQTNSDWPRTPLSSRITGMGAIVPSEWGSTISYEFDLTSFEEENQNILGDVPSVFDTPSQYQSNTTDLHPSQNTSARTSISPTILSAAFQNAEQRYAILGKEGDLKANYSSVTMSREMNLMPSPSSSNEDGLALLSSGVPLQSFGYQEVIRPRFSQYDLSHLQRRDAIVDPLNLINNTMIPSVVLPRESVYGENRHPMLPSIMSRRPSPEEEEYRHSNMIQAKEHVHENQTSSPSSMPSVMMQSERPSCFEPVPGPSTYSPNLPSVFAQPQNPNQFKVSTKELEMDGWTSSWPPTNEEEKGKKKKNKAKATTAIHSNVPHPNYRRVPEEMARNTKKDHESYQGMPQHQSPPPPAQQQGEKIACYQSQLQEERMFVEIKTQFQSIPENSDPSRFSSNGRCLIACEACKRRKMRCTNEFPTCQNCSRRGIQCQYAEKVRTRGKAKRNNLNSSEHAVAAAKTSLDNANKHDHKRRRISIASSTSIIQSQ